VQLLVAPDTQQLEVSHDPALPDTLANTPERASAALAFPVAVSAPITAADVVHDHRYAPFATRCAATAQVGPYLQPELVLVLLPPPLVGFGVGLRFQALVGAPDNREIIL
jgi:hypothetical protein